MTYTYTETITRVTSIHTSPARQQFLAVGGGVERPLSRRVWTRDEVLRELAPLGLLVPPLSESSLAVLGLSFPGDILAVPDNPIPPQVFKWPVVAAASSTPGSDSLVTLVDESEDAREELTSLGNEIERRWWEFWR